MALFAFSARVASTRPSALFSSDMINALMRCSIASLVLASPSSLISLHKLKVLERMTFFLSPLRGCFASLDTDLEASPDHSFFLPLLPAVVFPCCQEL
ncbi:hypothetical protein KC342_g105 [Hortaea werneckii]|nr:hypothetical protein KC342_g105 [Hortaea werneckii]